MANEKTPVVWDDTAKKHRPLGSGEKMGGLSASSMISADSGNLLQQGSDGLMLVTGGSIADPRADNLLEESANGKLQVTSDRVVEWLEGHPQAAAAIAEAVKVVSGDSGNVITAGTDKGAFLSKSTLASAVSTMSAAQLTTLANALRKQGGGLSVGSDGKLSVDFGSMDPAIMRNVVLSMVQQGGGIGVDSSGKLYVDFDSMPTDKFEAMMKSLKMLVPLTANKHLYVDVNSGSDTIEDGRGTQAKPFKHIQACINYLIGNYSLGRFHAYINVGAGTYVETLALPSYSTGGGAIHLRTTSGARDVTVTNDVRNNMVVCSVGEWYIEHFNLVHNEIGTNEVIVSSCVSVVSNGILHLSGNSYRNVFPASFNNSGQYYESRIINVDNATLYWDWSNMQQAITCADHADANTFVFDCMRNGQIILNGYSGTGHVEHETVCSGATDHFISVNSRSTVTRSGSGVWPTFTGAVSGKRYEVVDGSSIQTPPIDGVSSENYFPGNSDPAGTVEASTYCWYK